MLYLRSGPGLGFGIRLSIRIKKAEEAEKAERAEVAEIRTRIFLRKNMIILCSEG